MIYMLNCPDAMKRCQAEIDDVIGRRKAPSMKDKASMPYVEATVMEVLRIASTASFAVRSFHLISLLTLSLSIFCKFLIFRGQEAQPRAHLNANFKSINIC